MAAIASISINDGQATPVAHVFTPVQTMEPVTYANNASSSVPVVGQEQILLSLKNAARTSEAVNRAKVTLRIPVLEVPEGGASSGYTAPPKVAFVITANVEMILPNRSTAAQRKDARVLVSNLLTNAQVVDLIDQLVRPF